MRKQWELHHGEAMQWLISLPDNSVDAVITDPPYSSGGMQSTSRSRVTSEKYSGNKGERAVYAEFYGDARDQRVHALWMREWLNEAYRTMLQGAIICLFTDWRQLPLTADALQFAEFIWRGVMVWDKCSCRFVKGRPQTS